MRDLAWACFSPVLLNTGPLAQDKHSVVDCAPALTPARRQWLDALDRRPEALLEHLSHGKSRRLGIYFEQLWHFFLDQDSAFELLAHNLAVRDQGRTIGEFDLIYWCHERRRHFHLELAVKFFLSWRRQTTDGRASHWDEWLGPNSRDRLDLKLGQLLERQARLGEHPAARAVVAGLGIADLAREVAIKGYLFQALEDPLPAPVGFAPGNPLQQWLRLRSLADYLEALEATRFTLVPKALWLTPVVPGEQTETFNRSTLREKLQSLHLANPRARLVAAVGDGGDEIRRFFVTPDDWPDTVNKTSPMENV